MGAVQGNARRRRLEAVKLNSPALYRPHSMSQTLVIVESPSKCRKIEEYLGAGYTCIASYGHIRHLPDLTCIGPAPGYKLKFKRLPSRGTSGGRIAALKSAAARADRVILATDDDREGEAIAWHLKEVLRLPDSTPRSVFREVTRAAVRAAIGSPRQLDMDKVKAQWARQAMDLMVGFRISPVLWAGIQRPGGRGQGGLSAGRCQTPALRLVYDAHKEAGCAQGDLVYKTAALFTKGSASGHPGLDASVR